MNKTTVKSLIPPCLTWIVICLVISGLAGWVTESNIPQWYAHIQKPSFNPPAWVFGPVWTILYIMIGTSGGILWHQKSQLKLAFSFYLTQLILNFCWSFIFFGAHKIGWALLDMTFLIIFVALTIACSFKKSKAAALLLMPYLAWLVFAFVLNFTLWKIN